MRPTGLIPRLGLGSVKQYASGDSLTFVLLKSQVPTLILAVALAACTGVTARPTDAPASARPIASASVSVAPAEPDPGLVIVAIGDSIPFNLQDDCPGCVGFVDSYGAALEDALGRSVTVLNRSRHDGARTIDLLQQLQTDTRLLDELATADVVLVSIGFNDLPPFRDAYDGCPEPIGGPNPPISTLIELLPATSEECLDTVVQTIAAQVAEVLDTVREQAPRARIAALDAYDPDIGWSGYDGIDETTVSRIYATDVYWFDHWRDELCTRAATVDATCIAIYAAFNGPDGTRPAGDLLAADDTHPSQKGNDVIRDLLLEANLVQGSDT